MQKSYDVLFVTNINFLKIFHILKSAADVGGLDHQDDVVVVTDTNYVVMLTAIKCFLSFLNKHQGLNIYLKKPALSHLIKLENSKRIESIEGLIMESKR